MLSVFKRLASLGGTRHHRREKLRAEAALRTGLCDFANIQIA